MEHDSITLEDIKDFYKHLEDKYGKDQSDSEQSGDSIDQETDQDWKIRKAVVVRLRREAANKAQRNNGKR